MSQVEPFIQQKIAEANWYNELATLAKKNKDSELRMYRATHNDLERFRQLEPIHKTLLQTIDESTSKDKVIVALEHKVKDLTKQLAQDEDKDKPRD